LRESLKPKQASSARERHESWAALREAVLGVPAMLTAALASESHGREDAVRVARIARRLYADAVAELGEREAEDLVGAAVGLVRARIVDIFGPEAWDEAFRGDAT
jgi:hypothetical protein